MYFQIRISLKINDPVVAIVVLKIPDRSAIEIQLYIVISASRTRIMIGSRTDGGQEHHLEGGFLLV